MAAREPLTEKERRQVQWAYHKGPKEQKKVIQDLFGRHITHAGCLIVSPNELYCIRTYAQSITESDFWHLLCCAAFHNKIWEHPSAEGDIRRWVHSHCHQMGDSQQYEGTKLFEASILPSPIPSNWKIEAYKYLSLVIRKTAKLIGPVLIFILGYFFQRIANALFP